MMHKILLTFLLVFCAAVYTNATHVVGGALEYERIGTGSLPNSSRYKIKLKLWRDAAGNPWFPINPLIECRGDTLGYTLAGFDPYVATYPGGNIYPYSGLDRMNDFSTGTGISRQFIRDFTIACASPLDTLTVRTGAFNTGVKNTNTKLWPTTGVPGYENPSYVRSGYPTKQFLQDGYGFTIGVCDATGNSLGANNDRTNYTDACDANQTSPYGRLCVPQYVDSCTFVPKVFIQYAVYVRVVDLPNIPGGYHLKFNLSARNNAIVNLNNPGGTSFTVYARIPDIAQLDGSAGSFTNITTLTSSIVTTVTSVLSFSGTSASNKTATSTFTGMASINTIPGVFLTAYINLGIPGITAINANIITTNRVLVTSIAGTITTITSRIVSTSILGITTTGFTANSLAYPQVSSVTGLDVQITGVNTITAPYLNPTDNIRNSSPRFKSVPPLFVCQYSSYVASLGINQNPQFDHSAFDADGDSIQYDLVFPNDGSDGGSGPAKTDEMFVGYWKSATSANINGTIFTTGMPLYATTLAGFPYPENVNLATFNPVSFKSPFTDQLPLGNAIIGSLTTPGIVLNKSTGIMDIKPLVPPGLYVVSVRAREFRRPSGTVTGLRFLGDITRDYQFRVLSCPLPAQAFIGASIDPLGINVCKSAPTNYSPPNNSTAAAFSTGIFYWDSGKDRYVNSFGGPNLYPVRLNSSAGLMVTTPLGINEKYGNPASFSYSVPGTYYTKLVVQDRGSKCSDSVFAAINISNVKSGWFQSPRGPICVNRAIVFDPYQPNTLAGFSSVSGSSLWTNPETNLIPRVSVSGFTGVSATYTGIATSVNGTAMSLTNYTGYIDFLWMQPDGFSRKRIPPPVAAPAKIVFMTWNLGNGNFQSLTLAGSNWVSYGPIVPGLTITGANSIPNTFGGINLSLPGINYPYPAPGNFKVSLTIYNQFGCSDSLQRNITIIQQQPMASGIGGDVCINNAVISVTGNITIATGGIWSGGTGIILPSRTQTGNSFVIQYKPSAAELVPGSIVGLTLSTYGNGVCPIGNSTVIAVNIKDKPHVSAGPAATVCGNNMQYQLNGIVTGVGSNLSIDGGNFQAYWKSKGTGKFVGSGTIVGSNTTISTNTTSGFVLDTYMFSKADSLAGSVKLLLIAANTGICNSISDSIVLTMLPAAQLPGVTPGNNQLVCANNSKVVLNGSVTNSPLGGIWTTMGGSGTFAGFNTSTNTITGPNAFYIPSKGDSAAGSVKLILSTNITSVNGGCFNVSKFITVTIGPSPTIIFGAIPSACLNNPITNLVATIVGSTGVLWSGSGIPSAFGGGTYNPGSSSPNIVSLGSGIFQTSLTYTALNSETTSPGIKFINISTTGNGICSPVTAQSAINYQPAQVVSILGPAAVSVCKNNTSYTFTTKITNFKVGVTVGQWSSSGTGTFSPGVVLTTNSAVFTYTPSTADTATGNVRLIIAVTSNDGKGYDCKISYDTLNITYTNLPTIDAGPNQTICENNLIAKLGGSVTSPATGGIWSTNGTGSFTSAGSGKFTSTILGDNYFPSATDRSNGSVKLTLTTTGANIGSGTGQCAAIAKSINITFSSVPVIQFGTVPVVCENNASVFLTATIVGQSPGQNITATTMGTWGKGAGTYVPGVNNFNLVSSPSLGLVSSGSVTYTPDAFELASKVVNLAVTATGIGNCNAISSSLTFNISPKPTVDITTPNPTICGNNAHTTLNAVITGANGGIWSGGLNSVSVPTQTGTNLTVTYDPNSTEINNGSAKLYLTTNGVLNNCNPVVDSTLITITKAPVVSTGGPKVVCGDNNQVTITGTVLNAGGGIWTTSGTGTFLTSGASSVSINGSNMTTIYVPSATDKIDAKQPLPPFHLVLRSINNGNCLAVNDEMTLGFSTDPVANAGPPQTVCGNDFPIYLNATGDIGQWITSVPGAIGNATLLSTTFNPSMVIPAGGTVVGFTWKPDPFGSCGGTASTMLVTILPAPVVNIISAPVVCGSAGFFALSINGSGFSGGTWRAVSGVFSTTGANASTSIPDAYRPSAADITSGSVTISFTGDNTFPCSSKPTTKVITIDPPITIDPGPTQTFCDNITAISLTGKVFINGVQTTSGVNVLWNKLSTVGGLYTGASPTSTLYSPVFNPTNADKNSGSIILLMSTPGLGTCSSPGTSSVVYLFQKSPTATILGIPAVVCSDTSYIQLSGTFTGSAGMVWSTTGTGSFSPDNTNMNAKYVLSNGDKTVSGITFKIINVGSGLCTNSASATSIVTIVGKPIVDAGPDLTICGNNTAITLTGANTTTTGVSSVTGIWYLSNTVAPIGTFSANTIPVNGVGTLPVYFPSSKEKFVDQIVTVFVSVSGVGIPGNPNVCPGQNDKRIFTFTPAPVVTAGANQLLCGDATSNILTLTGSTTIANSGRWTANQGIGTLVGINGLTAKYSVNAADKSVLSTTLGFTFTVTFPGSTASIIGCVNVSTTTSIVLTSVPGVSITGGNQTICGDALFTNPLNGISSTGFGTWSTTTLGTFSPNSSTLTGAKFAPLLTEMVSAYTTGKPIKIKLNSGLNGVCFAKSDSIFVTVTTPPAITAGSDTSVCTDVGTVPLYGAVITVSSGMIWSTSSSQGRFINTGTITSQGITTTGPNALVRNIIVQDYLPGAAERNAGSVVLTARSTLSGTCANVFAVKNITFIKEPTVSVGVNQSVCSNNSVVNCNAVVTNAVKIRWLQVGGSGNFLDPTAASTQYFPGVQDSISTAFGNVVSITCSVIGNNLCQAKTATFALKVTPAPVVKTIGTVSICSDTSGVQFSGITLPALTTVGVQWANFTNPASTAANFSPSKFVLNPKYIPSAADIASGTVKLLVSTTGNGGCIAGSDTLKVLIQPKPIITAGPDQNLCSDFGGSIKFTFTGTNFSSGSTGTWTSSGDGNFGSPVQNTVTGIGNDPTFYNVSPGDFSRGRVTIQVASQEGKCKSVTVKVNVTFTGAPVVSAGNNQTNCYIVGNVLTLSGSVIGTETYKYTWFHSTHASTLSGTFANGSDTLSALSTIVGTKGIEKYTTKAGDGATETFYFLVTGTGICKNQYSSRVDLTNKKPIDLGITAPLTICSDITSFDVSIYDKRTGFGSDPTFSTVAGDGLVWSAQNSKGRVADFSQFSPGMFSASTFTYTPSNAGVNPDRSSTLIGFTFTSTGSSICPRDIVTANVIVIPAPTVVTLAGLTACSNNQTVSLTGIASNFSTVQWISSSAPIFQGTFTGANSLSGTYTPSSNEISNGIANLVLTASKYGCNDVSAPLAIGIKQAPVVNAGAPGSICSLTGITVTGTIQPPLSTVTGSLWAVDGASPGSGTPGTQVVTSAPGIMSVQNTFSALSGGPFITLRLTALESSCLPVSSTVTYTFVGTPVLDAGPPRSQCASDVIQLTPGAASAMGLWTTSGQGVFASTNTITTANMNDIYLPSAGEILNGTVIGFTLVGQPSSCGTPANKSVNYTITSGITVKADAKKVVSVCTNASPTFRGTISGSSLGLWTSNGSGTFANGGNTVTGTLVGSNYVFEDTYTPSDPDKAAGRVVLRLTAAPDGINSLCNNNAYDTLSLFFTAPPTVNANGDKRVCANVAITTIAGGGVSISGSAFLPSPNSTDPNATPVNAARWRWLSSSTTPGYFMSTGTTTGQVVSFAGVALNITINLSEVYIPTSGEAFNTSSPVKLILESFYVGAIVGGATCVPAVDTIEVNFNPAPSANIIFTGTGICTDIDQFDLYGNIAQASGGVWSTSGTGSLVPDNVWNSPIIPTTYKLSAAEIATTTPINVKFTLETTNNPGCYSTISSVLTVTINPRPIVTVTGGQIICADLTTITLTGGSATAFAGAFPVNYTWITNGTGSISGLNSVAGANMPGLYTLNQSDISFGSLLFTLSTSGPNTCKPITKNMDVTITPAPTISLTSRQELCRDSDTMKVTATVAVATGVTWTTRLCFNGVCTTPGTGTFFSGTGVSLTGVYLPSVTDLSAAAADSIEFTAQTTGNNVNGSSPSCNSVTARTYIQLTPRPTVSITSLPGICADLTSISLSGVVSVAGGGKWASTGGGMFFTEFSLPTVSYQLSDTERNFIFPTTIGISLTSDANGTCKPVVSNFILSITGSPKVETGPDRNVCADSKSINLSAAVATLTGGGFAWNTFGTGTFTGTSSTFTGITTLPGSWTYAPSPSDSANGAVILVLTTTGPNPCNPVESYITIKFDRTPNVIISAGVDQVVCADNPLINLDGRTNGQNPSWHAFKDPTIPGNSTVNGMGGNGIFSPDTTTLNASYFPSVQDTTGATSTFTNQVLKIRLRAYGTGTCSSQVYESNMNVTFTPLPRLDVLISPSSICTNDQTPITLSGVFLNNIAGGGAWTSSGSANSAIPFVSVLNPPSVTGIVYQPTAADKINGSGGSNSDISGRVGFTFTTQAQGTCRAISKSIPLIIYKAPSINPGTDKAICETQTLVSLSGISTGVLTGRWRSSGSGKFLNGTNPGANMATITGGKINDSYSPTAADVAAGSINLFLASRTQSNGCPSDSARIALSFDLVPIISTGLTQTICAEPGLVSLTGVVLNATKGIWSVSTPGSGSFNPGADTVNTVYKLSENDKNISPLVFTLTSNSSTSRCPQVSSAPLVININKVPIASIDYTYLCTSTGIRLFGGISNALFGTWTTSGTGVFSPTSAPVPFITGGTQYAPSDVDLTGVTITLEAHGLGACPSSKAQITPSLTDHPSPFADAGSDATICTSQLYELNVVGLNDNSKTNYTYQWLKPSITGVSTVLSAIAKENILSVTVYANSKKGDSLYVLEVTDNVNKCVTLDTVKIRAIEPRNLGLEASTCYVDNLILPTRPVTITGGAYQWYIDGEISQQDKNPNRIKANTPGNYTLQFTEFGCQSSATTLVKGRVILQTRGKVTCVGQETILKPYIVPYVQNTLIVVTLSGGTTVLGVRKDTLFPDYVYKWYFPHNKLYLLGSEAGNYASEDTTTTLNLDGSLTKGKYARDTIHVKIYQDTANIAVSVSAFGCETIDTVRVKTHPIPDMQLENISACIGDLIQLEGRPSNMESPKKFHYPPPSTLKDTTIWSTIKWNTFPSGIIQPPMDTVHKITVTTDGIYFVKYQIDECIGLDNATVNFNFLPTVTNLSMVKYCPEGGNGITLDAGYGAGYHYLWLASGKESQYEIVYDTLKYYFKVFTNKNCSVLDSINVNASCAPKVFTPDAFIPDGDNPENQYFRVFGKNFVNFNIRIYNRWGEVIFSSHDKDFGWDGKYQGSKMPTGVYPYVITYDGQYEDYRKQKIERGKVTLVR